MHGRSIHAPSPRRRSELKVCDSACLSVLQASQLAAQRRRSPHQTSKHTACAIHKSRPAGRRQTRPRHSRRRARRQGRWARPLRPPRPSAGPWGSRRGSTWPRRRLQQAGGAGQEGRRGVRRDGTASGGGGSGGGDGARWRELTGGPAAGCRMSPGACSSDPEGGGSITRDQ